MPYTTIDLFSGGGGMSFGFHSHPDFQIQAAVDAQFSKPSTRGTSTNCNSTYEANIGIKPTEANLAEITPQELSEKIDIFPGQLDVMLACPPCTGFSRAGHNNLKADDPRNSLMFRVSEFVEFFGPKVVVMENVKESLTGKYKIHSQKLISKLQELGYTVNAEVHMLSQFGLPQNRKRALTIAVAEGFELHTLSEAWEGWEVDPASVTVRRAISHLPKLEQGHTDPHDPMHVTPGLTPEVLARIHAIPHDGGVWRDIAQDNPELLTNGMRKFVAAGDTTSFSDSYSRMYWDRPSMTIKRESAHVASGRYSHPEQDRLCSVREMGILCGFPDTHTFVGSVANKYRHIGDAVAPLISYQLAHIVAWVLKGEKPVPSQMILPNTSLRPEDIHRID